MAKTGKRYHHGELKEALVTAGRKLLEEKGLRGFTLRECARRAQVSHAAPAHHFKSMDDLLAEIAARGYQDIVILRSAARQLGRKNMAWQEANETHAGSDRCGYIKTGERVIEIRRPIHPDLIIK